MALPGPRTAGEGAAEAIIEEPGQAFKVPHMAGHVGGFPWLRVGG